MGFDLTGGRIAQQFVRPKAQIPVDKVLAAAQLPLLEAAAALGVSESTMRRWRRDCQKTPLISA